MNFIAENDKAVLRDGVFVHEADEVCRKLEQAGIPFEICQVSKDSAGIIESHQNNWSTALGSVLNYFNQGGLGVYLRIIVKYEDLDRANATLDPKSTDGGKQKKKTFLLWTFLIVAMALFIYAFVDRAKRDFMKGTTDTMETTVF
jgi:hypothetical protein